MVREAIDACKIALWSAESAEAHAVLGGSLSGNPRMEMPPESRRNARLP